MNSTSNTNRIQSLLVICLTLATLALALSRVSAAALPGVCDGQSPGDVSTPVGYRMP